MTAIDTLTRNLRHAARMLIKTPGFTIAAVATRFAAIVNPRFGR